MGGYIYFFRHTKAQIHEFRELWTSQNVLPESNSLLSIQSVLAALEIESSCRFHQLYIHGNIPSVKIPGLVNSPLISRRG